MPSDAARGDKANASLYGVACPAPGSCVAVGVYTQANGNTQGLIETLANGTWTPATAPLPASGFSPRLNAVSCPAVGSCVAVGVYTPFTTNNSAHVTNPPLIETLANGTWHGQAAPLPKGAGPASSPVLWSVACPASGVCAAVGQYFTDPSDKTNQGLIATLAKGTWKTITAPLPANAATAGQSALLSVTCPALGDCVAAGGYTDTAKHGQPFLESTRPVSP